MRKRRPRRAGREAAFTLIELMVVVVVMAILMAIAIPAFLSTKGGANDSATKSDLTNGIINLKSFYTNNRAWPGSQPSLSGLDPSLTWIYEPSSAAPSLSHTNSVYVYGAGPTAYVYGCSETGACYYIKDTEGAAGAELYASTSPAVTTPLAPDAGSLTYAASQGAPASSTGVGGGWGN
ncbi:MAG: type II secretion system protein [Acidimicrobiales bacterium]